VAWCRTSRRADETRKLSVITLFNRTQRDAAIRWKDAASVLSDHTLPGDDDRIRSIRADVLELEGRIDL